MWPVLKQYMLKDNPEAADETHFMCNYCKSKIRSNKKNLGTSFYLLWQKEMRELSAGVYNVMKSSKTKPMSVSNLLNKVEASDEH